MGSVALEGFGSGGAALNFKVVPGLTQPGTASENTIWVKTEKINNWYFSATQPEGMQEWDVWFQTGTEKNVEFNALKKNGIQVYPLRAKQYVSGALVDVEAKSYQNGKWSEWATYLFNYGKQKYKWQARAWAASNYTPVAPTVSVNSDGSVTLTMPKASSGYNSGVYELVEDFDLTNVDKLVAEGTNMGAIGMYVVNRNSQHWAYPYTVASDSFADGECVVDTSGISGSYDILIGFLAGTDASIGLTFKTLKAEEAQYEVDLAAAAAAYREGVNSAYDN